MVHHNEGEFGYNIRHKYSKSYYQDSFDDSQFRTVGSTTYVNYTAAKNAIANAYDSVIWDKTAQFWQTTSDPDNRLFSVGSSTIYLYQPGNKTAYNVLHL